MLATDSVVVLFYAMLLTMSTHRYWPFPETSYWIELFVSVLPMAIFVASAMTYFPCFNGLSTQIFFLFLALDVKDMLMLCCSSQTSTIP